MAPCRGKKPGGGGGRLLNSPTGAGVYPPGGGATPGKPGGGGGGGAGKPGGGGGKGALGKLGGGGGIPAIPGGKPGGGGGRGKWGCDDIDTTQPRHQRTPDIEWVRLTCATRRGTIGHRDVIVRVHFFFVLRHARWWAFWHWNIVVHVLYIRANQSTDKYIRMNGSSPPSSGLLVEATFLEVWLSLGCRRERYTSFRCSGCSSRYFSFFLTMLSSSAFKSLSLFWSASESDVEEESFSIPSSRSRARCYNLQVLRSASDIPHVSFFTKEKSRAFCLSVLFYCR